MTDKERILSKIIQRGFSNLLYSNEKCIKTYLRTKDNFAKGDLVVAMTTISAHEFLVSIVEECHDDHLVVREIGSKRLCNYHNESFIKIDKEILGYEVLEGIQYQTYVKVMKALGCLHHISIRNISFDNQICLVETRRFFSDSLLFTISFKYNKRTSVKKIVELLQSRLSAIESEGEGLNESDLSIL